MKKLLLAAFATALVTTACTTTNIKTTTNDFEVPSSDVGTILFAPDVEMSSIHASGLLEPRADWSQAAQKNLQNALEAKLKERDSKVYFMDADAELTDEQVQMLKLKDAVLIASQNHHLLKHKKDVYDLTLGPGASILADDTGARFALLTRAQGSFQSAGKVAVNIAMALIGGPIQTGAQFATLSLVDLETGDVVWTNNATIGGGSDPRKPEGAERVAETLLKDFPLE